MFAVLLTLLPLLAIVHADNVHPGGNTKLCLEARGIWNGAEVFLNDCTGTDAQNWTLKAGATKVQLAGKNYCLDAGSNPASGIKMKVWQCYDNLPAQAWWLTGDGRLAVEGKGQCLDVTDGKFTAGTVPQTWQCTDWNSNQVWSVSKAPPPTTPIPSTSVKPTTVSAPIPSTTVAVAGGAGDGTAPAPEGTTVAARKRENRYMH